MKILGPLLCLALLINALLTGWWGIDFGVHWDEWYLLQGLRNAVGSLTLVTGEYSYGGVYFDLGFALLGVRAIPLLPAIFREIAANPTRPLAIDQYPALVSAKNQLLSTIVDPSFQLEARLAFLTVCSLAALWIYLAVRRLFPGHMLAALAGAGLMATSWEVAYHSRFVASDAVLMQFGALTFLCLAQALTRREPLHAGGWIAAAAVAAGLAAGSKLPGVFVLAPVLAAAALRRDLWRSYAGLAISLILTVVIFVVAFCATTPGAFVDPIRFAATIPFEAENYNRYKGGGFPYFVANPYEHARYALRWLFAAVPSPAVVLAVPMSLVTAAGAYALWRDHRRLLWCMAVFVLSYGLFVCANHVLIVRNWLVVVPLSAIAFAAGIALCQDLVRGRRFGWLVGAGVTAVFAYNIIWLWRAADSVRHSSPAAFVDRLYDYMKRHPSIELHLSPDIVAAIKSGPGRTLACRDIAIPPEKPSKVIFFAHEHDWMQWIANRPAFADLTIGSLEVNYDYYPTWFGRYKNERIVVLPAANAVRMGKTLAGFQTCQATSPSQ